MPGLLGRQPTKRKKTTKSFNRVYLILRTVGIELLFKFRLRFLVLQCLI
jgi:hypothetical protein